MDNYISNLKSWIVALIIGLIFSIFVCFCSMVYCTSEIEILKEYHSNICSECGQTKN